MTVKDAFKRAQNDACISSVEREHARPTVKDIFALRKQGKIEEAYEAIRARYATYRGKYTTLCMFWTAADVFKLRVQQERFYEATKIFQALRRVLPNIDDKDGHAAGFMHFAGSQLGQLRRDRATAPAGIIATMPAGSPAVPAEPLSKGQAKVLDCIKAHPGLRVPGIEAETGIPAKSIERHIKVLIERKLIEHRGSKKTGGYHALDSTFGRLPLGFAAFTKRSD